MLNLMGLNVAHHRFTKVKICTSIFLGIFLMAVGNLILCSFIQPATADAASSIDYSTLAEWKSVGVGAPVISVAFSSDQSMVAGGLDGKIELYSDKLELIKELKASENKKPSSEIKPLGASSTDHRWMMALAFSPDSKLIAAACYDGTVRIWDVKTGAETICKDSKLAHDEWTARSHNGPVRAIAFSPDGSKIVSGGDDKAVKMWDVKTGKLLWDGEEHVFRVVAVAFSTDGSTISSVGAKDVGKRSAQREGTGEFKLWDANAGRLKQSVIADGISPNGVAISPDGSVVISADSANGVTNLWDFRTGSSAYPVTRTYMVSVDCFSPDGSVAVIGNPGITNSGSSYRKSITNVSFLAVQSGQLLFRKYFNHVEIPAYVLAIAMSKDNRSLAFGCQDGAIQIWRVP